MPSASAASKGANVAALYDDRVRKEVSFSGLLAGVGGHFSGATYRVWAGANGRKRYVNLLGL